MGFKINLGSLTVQIGADTEDFEDGQEKVKTGLKKTDSALRKSANDFVKWGAAAALAATVAVAAFAKTQLSAIKELKNLSQAANTTVKEFQRGAFAAASVGIETEKYGDILKDVNDRIGDFLITGGGPMIDFFEKVAPKIGITADAFRGLSGQQAMGLYVDSLDKANLSQEEMTFFMEAMASDSTLLIPLLRDNGKAFKELSDEAKALGIGLDDLDVIKASIASAEIAKSVAATDSLAKKLTVALTPAITGITQAFNDSAKTAGGWDKVIEEVVRNAVKALGFVWDAVRGIKVIFKGVEVVARVVFTEIAKVFDTFRNTSLKELGRSMLDDLVKPFRTSLVVMSIWSDTAQEAVKNLDKTLDETLGKPRVGLGEFAQSQVDALKKSKEELAKLAGEEMPSIGLEAATKAAFKAFDEEVAKRAADKKALDEKNAAGESGEGTGLVPVAEVYKAESISLFEAMGARFQTTEELQLSQNQRELELLKGKLSNGFILEKEFKEKSLELEKSSADAQRNLMVSNMSGALSHFASNSKKMQKLQTAAQVVSAVKSGYSAAVKAWDYGMLTGPWTAAAYAGASLVKTGALISKIKSGGKSQSSSGGGFSAPATNQGQARQSQQSQGSSGPDRAIQINLTGGAGSLFTTEQVRNLIESINEQIGDGVSLGLAGA